MTDYLELAEQENADALWEATRDVTLLPARRNERDTSEPEMGEVIPENLPLLEELQQAQLQLQDSRMERRGAVPGNEFAPEAVRWNGTAPVWDGATQADELAGMPVHGTLQSQGEDLVWAQRIDRVFQRDSRRYDGGFFLY